MKVDLKERVNSPNIDLFHLIECANSHSQTELLRLVEDCREKLILGLCCPEYSRSHPYRRGFYDKTLVTSLGTIRLRVRRVIRRGDESARSLERGA